MRRCGCCVGREHRGGVVIKLTGVRVGLAERVPLVNGSRVRVNPTRPCCSTCTHTPSIGDEGRCLGTCGAGRVCWTCAMACNLCIGKRALGCMPNMYRAVLANMSFVSCACPPRRCKIYSWPDVLEHTHTRKQMRRTGPRYYRRSNCMRVWPCKF